MSSTRYRKSPQILKVQSPTVNGYGHVVGTEQAQSGVMQMRAELFSAQTGQLIGQAVQAEQVVVPQFRFEEYLGKIGEEADGLLSDQIGLQLESVFGLALTDEMLTQMAVQRLGGDPTAPGLDLMKDQIRSELAAVRQQLQTQLESGVRFGLQYAIEGDQLDHHFAMGAGHPQAPEFALSLAASKGAYDRDFSELEVKDIVKFNAPVPSIGELQSIFSGPDPMAAIDQMLLSIPLTLTIDLPMVQLMDGVAFQAGSSFTSPSLLPEALELSEFEVNAAIEFSPPLDSPPVLFGPNMRGRVGGFYRQSQSGGAIQKSDGADADLFGVRGQFNY